MQQFVKEIENRFSGFITNKRYVLVALMLIIVLGSFLRIYKLDYQSLGNDELSTIRRSSYENISNVAVEKVVDVHPPGQYILYYFVIKYLGNSENIMRLPPLIAGVFSILFMFLIGRRIYSEKEGLISASLLAFLWCPIFYSQEARSYSLLLFFILLSTWLLLLMMHKFSRNIKNWFWYAVAFVVSAIISCYMHYFGLLFIVLLGIGAIIYYVKEKRQLVRILLIYTVIFFGYLPWLPYILNHLNADAISIKEPHFIDFIYFFEFLFNWSEKLTKIVFLFYSFLFVYTIYHIIKNKLYKKPGKLFFSAEVLLGLWLILPFILVFIKSEISVPVLTYKNLIISLPAAYLLLARSVTMIPLKAVFRFFVTIALIGLFIGNLIFYQNYYNTPTKHQFREAVKYVAENDKLLNNSIVIGFAWDKSYFNYYFEKQGYPKRIKIIAGEKDDVKRVFSYIDSLKPSYTWYIAGHLKPDKEFIEAMKRKMTVVDSCMNFIEMNIWLFKN